MNAPLRGYTLDFIQSMLTEESGRTSGWFEDLELKSAFQPAFSLPQKHAVAFEASLRAIAPNGKAVSPDNLFGPVENYAETAMLDMLSMTLHVHNFFSRPQPHGTLFVNLHPEVLLDHGNSAQFLASLLSHYKVSSGKIIIDMPGSVLGHAGLDDAVAAYRQLGCLVSVDDFGVDNADLDSVAHVTPAIVKMGRTVVTQAMKDERQRHMLPRAVSLLHEMGTLVLMEGLESEGQALLAIDADADFASGFFFGPHVDSVTGYAHPHDLLNRLWDSYRMYPGRSGQDEPGARASLENEKLHSSHAKTRQKASPSDIARHRQQRRPYLTAMLDIAAGVKAGDLFEASCDAFLSLDGAIRCFLLDGSGKPAATDVFAAQVPERQSADFYTVSADHDGDWSRRDFFRRAIKEPGVVQVTRQHCSLIGYARCVTFSLAIRDSSGKTKVIGGDVDWSAHAGAH